MLKGKVTKIQARTKYLPACYKVAFYIGNSFIVDYTRFGRKSAYGLRTKVEDTGRCPSC